MNQTTKIEIDALSKNEVVKPKDIHALWLLLKAQQKIDKKTASKVGRDVFSFARSADILRLAELGSTLGLLDLTNKDAWLRNDDGRNFAELKHWRYWTPNAKAISVLGKSSAATIFLGPRKSDDERAVIDLFAGVGGLSLGFQAAGFDVKVAVDNDPQACEAHEKNFPECAVIKGDINEIAADPKKYLCDAAGIDSAKVSGVIGGPPCQGFSYMGERASGDERNLLTSRFMDVVMTLEPDFFLMENVAGLLTSGALPKLSSYVQRLGKSIGEPATRIVDLLPEAKIALAKRDRQFRKRTVSQAITSYRLFLLEKITDTFELDAGTTILSHIFVQLPVWIQDKVVKAYLVEDGPGDDFDAIKLAISKAEIELAQLSIGLFVDVLLERGLLSEAMTEDYLKSLSSARKTPALVKKTIKQMVDEYDAAPRSQIYKGVTVGPIIAHLIERASEKYEVTAPKLLNAAWYGTPQGRQRLFLIGIHKRLNRSFVFPEQQFCLPGQKANLFEESVLEAPTVFDAIGDLPDIDNFQELIESDQIEASNYLLAQSDYARKMRLDSIESDDYLLPRPTWNPFVIDCCNRTIHTEDVIERLKQTPEGIQEETSHKTRLNRMKVSHTLRAGTREGKGSHTAVRPVHYEYHRVISVREGARIMGYPDWMTFHRTKWHGFRLVGNGVPFQLGRALAKAILLQIKASPDGCTTGNASE